MALKTENNLHNQWRCSDTRVNHIKYEWEIKNFKDLPQKNGEALCSSIFPEGNDKKKWTLGFYPRGKLADSAEYISLILFLLTPKLSKIRVTTEITIIQSNVVMRRVISKCLLNSAEGSGHQRILERSKLLTGDLSDDTITISCKLYIFEDTVTISSNSMNEDSLKSFRSARSYFTHGLRLLFKDQSSSDFTIIVGKKKFTAHKVVLANRSPVFATIIKNTCKNENSTRIIGIEPKIMEAMLEFIYTDDVTNIRELAGELLVTAEEYKINGLKALCEEALFTTVHENNAAEILSIADAHNADALKRYVMQYVVNHRCGVVDSKAFEDARMSVMLCKELIRSLARSPNVKFDKC